MKKAFFINYLVPILIFVLNLYLIYPLFKGEYTQFMGSIEAQLLAQSKFISENFPEISWYPFWYNGFPFQLVYPPLVSFTLSFWHLFSGLSLGAVYRILTALFYCLGAVSIYFLSLRLTSQFLAAFISALIYSAFPSAVFLIPGISEIGQYWSWPNWRLLVLTLFGEGAHIWALSLVPLALLFYLNLLRKPKALNFALSAIFISLILLTSFTSFMGLLIFLFIVFIAEAARSLATLKLYLSFLLALFVLGLSAFWYNFAFWKTIVGFARPGGGGSFFTGIYSNPSLIISFSLPVLAIFMIIFVSILRKKPQFSFWLIGLGSFLIFWLTLYFRYQFSFALLPLPFDYLPRIGPEVELAFALTAGLVLAAVFKFLQKWSKLGTIFGVTLALILLALMIKRAPIFHQLLQPSNTLEQTSEYQVAKFLETQAGQNRIYATGTHAFWLNVFSNVPQLRGDADQVPRPIWLHLIYQIYFGEDGQLAVDWLRALGYKYVVVNLPESKVFFKDYVSPAKFEGLAKKVFEYQGDVVYLLPTLNPNLVGMITTEKLEQLPSKVFAKEGSSILDTPWLAAYLQQTESNPNFSKVSYEFQKPWNRLIIQPQYFEKGSGVLVRQNYYPGWQAFQAGQKLTLRSDPLGFILIEPQSDSEIELVFRPPFSFYLGYLLSILTIFLLIWYLRSKAFRKLQKNFSESILP